MTNIMIDYKNLYDNKLFNCDCMEHLKDIPDKFFNLAIVDPPYGIKIKITDFSMNGSSKNKPARKTPLLGFNDNIRPSIEYFIELLRVSKNQIIWGGQNFIGELAKAMEYHKMPGDNFRQAVFWDKKTGNFSLSDGEIALTSFKKRNRLFEYRWNGACRGTASKHDKVYRFHLCEKPVQLYEWLLNEFAKPQKTQKTSDIRILDTHLGSANSIAACKHLGYTYTGFEIDSKIYEKSLENLIIREGIYNDKM